MKEDELGKVDIPDNQSFFFVMTSSTINIILQEKHDNKDH